MKRRFWMALLAACWSLGLVRAQPGWNPNANDLNLLVQRFRPYLKFSDGSRQEARPMTWQNYYQNSRLKKGGSVVLPLGALAGANATQAVQHAPLGMNGAKDYSIEIDQSQNMQYGDDWTSVQRGNGIYAHVTYLKTVTGQWPSQNLVNIEYWVMFGLNVGYVSAEDHPGDLIGVQMVYDHASDKIVRAAFSEHGQTLIMFDLARSAPGSNANLDGKNIGGGHITQAACKVESQDHGYYDGGLSGGAGIFRGGDHHVFFTRDPLNGRCEHLAIYLEHGSHEPWPNQSGYFIGVPNHNGDDISFLPSQVHVLGPGDAPFVNFGGTYGDPVGIARHRMWLGYDRTNPTDGDPYVDHENLKWLPVLRPTP